MVTVLPPLLNRNRPSSDHCGFTALVGPLTFRAEADASLGTSQTSDSVPLFSSMRVLTVNETQRASGERLGAATVFTR
jgi:hypothetical protein